MTGDVNKAMEQLITAASQVGGAAWPMLVRRMWISGWIDLNFMVCLMTILWSARWQAAKKMREFRAKHLALVEREVRYSGDTCPDPWFLTLIAAALSLIVLGGAAHAIRDILAPEAGVIWHLMGR